MDFVRQRHLLHVSHAPPPCTTFSANGATHPSSTNFPIIVILAIGMLVTSFFLMGYYIFVIKCCLNWQDHRVHHTRRLSLSRQGEGPSSAYSTTASEPRGLEEAVIRLIPVIQYKPEQEGEREFCERSICCECAVCLNEFQEDEKLRVIPNCSHVFHIDCIDVWLQNHAHCPICRRTISLLTNHVVGNVDHLIITPRTSPQDQSQNIENIIAAVDDDFVVNDLDGEQHGRDQNLQGIRQEELPTTGLIGLASQRRLLLEQRILHKKGKTLNKVTSLGDECIGVGAKDERFTVQTMRRSFSMDSSVNRQFYVQVQQALHLQQQNEHVSEVSAIEACDSSASVKRSFFSFGHGSKSRNVVLPVSLEP